MRKQKRLYQLYHLIFVGNAKQTREVVKLQSVFMKSISRLWRFIKRTFLFLFIAHIVYLVVLKWVNPPITITQIASVLKSNGFKRTNVAGNEISPNAKLAVIASEDQLFPDHNGFDWKSIQKAMEYNQRNPVACAAEAPSASKQPKTFFYGRAAVGYAKGFKLISLL